MQLNTRTGKVRMTTTEHRHLKNTADLVRGLSRFETDDIDSAALEQHADFLDVLATKHEPEKKATVAK